MALANGRIAGQTAVVVGGSRGIGLGLVKRLLDRENNVIATARVPAEAVHLSELKAQHPQHLTVMPLDVSQPHSIKSWAADLHAAGCKHIDVLINSAGIYGRRVAFAEFEEDDFLSTFKTNALGPFFVVQQLHKQGLLGPPKSLVVNITSIMASHGDPTVSSVTGGGYAYRASKGALNIMTKALAMDLAKDGITSLVVHPGYVKTDMTGGNGWVSVEESTAGIMDVLESGKELNGKFYAFSGEEIPW